MNHTCNGHYIFYLGLYRCLGDGKIHPSWQQPVKGQKCPGCKRPIESVKTVRKNKLRVRVVVTSEVQLIPGPYRNAEKNWVTLDKSERVTNVIKRED